MINLEDSIVLIKSVKKENVIGTGFIFHKQQNYTYLLTCAHVIKDVGGEENIRVNNLPAEVIKIGDVQGLDLAILKINTTFSASRMKLKKSRALVHLIDATEMFIRAISQERQNEGTPTPEGINNALLNTDFEGMTGQIKIIKDGENKGDRQDAYFYLIKPDCNENGKCEWMRLNPHSAGQN